MILTAAFIISKAIGATWSWWWLLATFLVDNGVDFFTTNKEEDE